jgi:hypothetical protein
MKTTLRRYFFLTATAVSFLTGSQSFATPDSAGAKPLSFREQLLAARDQYKAHPETMKATALTIQRAYEVIEQPIVIRVPSIHDFHLTDGVKGRKMEPSGRIPMFPHKENAELYGLATYDIGVGDLLIYEMPLIAAAYVITGDQKFIDYLARQIDEIAGWEKFQRPGWTLTIKSTKRGPDYDDGVFIATGAIITGVVQSLGIVGDSALPPETVKKIKHRLEIEMKQIMADFKAERVYYAREKMYQSNPWIGTMQGQLLAACYLGKELYPEEYAYARQGLALSVESPESSSGFSEGFIYGASRVLPGLALVNYYLQQEGDFSFDKFSLFQQYPDWICAHYQPGKNIVNCFDGYTAQRNMYDRSFNPFITQLAVLSRNPHLLWILATQHQFAEPGLAGILFDAFDPLQFKEPPLFAVFDPGMLLTWRNSWQENASGVWIRGRHEKDFHVHSDSGHVNFIWKGIPVLIEAGTPGYSDIDFSAKYYSSLFGHNVVQIGSETVLKNPRDTETRAPITVRSLNAQGGDVSIDSTDSYLNKPLKVERQVKWDADTVTITDHILLSKPEKIIIRFHTSSDMDAVFKDLQASAANAVTNAGTYAYSAEFPKKTRELNAQDILELPKINFSIQSTQPLLTENVVGYNHTLRFRMPKLEHTIVGLQTTDPVAELTVITKVSCR